MGRRGAPAFVFRLSAQSPQIGLGGGEVLVWGLGFGCRGEVNIGVQAEKLQGHVLLCGVTHQRRFGSQSGRIFPFPPQPLSVLKDLCLPVPSALCQSAAPPNPSLERVEGCS